MKVPKARKLSSGKWFIQLRLGGESIPVTANTEKECTRQAQAVKAEYLIGKRSPKKPEETDSPTLNEAIDSYISARDNTLSPLTVRGYRTIQKHRFKSTLPRRLDEIPESEWQVIVNQEAALCSPKTLKNAWGFIRSVVEDATGKKLPEITLPVQIPAEKPFLSPDEIKKFVSAVKDTKYAVPCLLALCSLRVSEIQALKWQNIPQNPKFIRVSGAVVLNEDNKYIEKRQNKNVTSARKVPIMIPELAVALERDRKPSGPVLEIHQNSLRCAIKKICSANGLPNVGVHGLRHSFASLAYHLQIPDKIAMEIGGWADATTMHKIYTHIAKSDIARYETALSAFYRSEENANKNANEE